MDRHLPDDQLDRTLRSFFTERRDELLATAPTAHLVAARIALTVSPTAARRRRLALALPVASLIPLLAAAAIVVGSRIPHPSLIPAERGVFTLTGMTATRHEDHTATMLADGRVLVIGGYGNDTGLAEAWHPATGLFSPAGFLTDPRMDHTGTLLPDGRILVVGGVVSSEGEGPRQEIPAAELWEPATSAFSPTGVLGLPRRGHSALLLPDGRVLVVGGTSGGDDVDSVEIWDPASGFFALQQWPDTVGHVMTAVLLTDGRVLLLGRTWAQVWDPASGTFEASGRPIVGHVPAQALLLRDGRVLVLSGEETPSADVWDPGTGVFGRAGVAGSPHLGDPAMALLTDGRVLVAGGWDGWRTDCPRGSGCTGPSDIVELWDPATGTFNPTGSMRTARSGGHTATTLPDGRVLVVGTTTGVSAAIVAELFQLR